MNITDIFTSTMAVILIIMKLFFFHCIGEFSLRSNLIETKRIRSIYAMLVHCTVYTGVMYFAFWLLIPSITDKQLAVGALIIFIMHYYNDNTYIREASSGKYTNIGNLLFKINQASNLLFVFLVYISNS